ncbi:MAG TPA: SRPBCC family protein [Edaphobacter sp.]|nr:SRPBCC family protein [Edaphobacter sp.]
MTALRESSKADALPNESGAASLLNGHYAPPPQDKDGKTWVRTSATIQAPAQKLYQMWRDIEAAPSWHERILETRKTGPNTYHWVMRDEPGEQKLEWEFETLADEPEKRITWRSISGEPESAGEVIFEPAPGGHGTMVTVLEQFRMGKLARTWEAITGRDPKQSVIENLRHFKALAETGEIPRIEPQPHGERGTAAGIKRSIYGEKIQTPAGTQPSEALTDRKGAA